ncbi:hypothetical protein CO2235_150006 [Cupriavidus oxalaticus]|uniref:Uncharacterized protein n=1 Tax=Cupriavidus oxalaticus TaxID=96344 RepID=A0A375FRF4_9BURK|nr:hypothetical protein CO2235_U600109 [Cupriavidus oxalaticus]SPC12351.1 hypothetical protein CO2235_150006 [Cupriavidus oxalaticus]
MPGVARNAYANWTGCIPSKKQYPSDCHSTEKHSCVTHAAGTLGSPASCSLCSWQFNWQRPRTPVPAAATRWKAAARRRH